MSSRRAEKDAAREARLIAEARVRGDGSPQAAADPRRHWLGRHRSGRGRGGSLESWQDRLWNFVDLLYLNQGEENTGYVTPGCLHRLLAAVPGLDVPSAFAASRAPAANAALGLATRIAEEDGVDGTPSFLIGRAGGFGSSRRHR